MEFIKISWEELEKESIQLAHKIKATHIDEITSISRGGLVVSRLLSDFLDLPISHIAIESYHDLQKDQEPLITQAPSKIFQGETVLLVDDLSDTGKTFLRAKSYLEALPIKKVYTAALYCKPQTVYIPDFFVKKMDGWLIFPYEIKETKKAFIKQFGKEEAERKLQEIGVPEWERNV